VRTWETEALMCGKKGGGEGLVTKTKFRAVGTGHVQVFGASIGKQEEPVLKVIEVIPRGRGE